MGQALYRTHRPLKLAEVVGQEHVTTALAHALQAGTISHAYLFTGPRGVGKTSIARILAHEINGLPYTDDATHLDIIEIDAASNRRIDEIRDLRDKVHIAPAAAKYKVYIIDEVHMLTREAFNALLKTLEEPPAHAVFILATTEVHKLPETIISRTQRYAFKPVALPNVVAHLQHIAKQEKIDIEPAALELIAAHGEGSFRDSISLLDQARNSGKKVTLADVQTSLGIAPAAVIEELLNGLATHDGPAIVNCLRQAREQGYETRHVAKQLGEQLRQHLLTGQLNLPAEAALPLLEKLIEVPASADPATYLEVVLLDTALAGQTPVAASPTRQSAQTAAQPPSVSEKPVKQAPSQPAASKAAEAVETPSIETTNQSVLDAAIWPQVLGIIKQKYNTLYGILRTAQTDFQPGQLRLHFMHAFHQKRAQDPKNRQIIAETIRAVTGQTVKIDCLVAENPPKTPTPVKKTEPTPQIPATDPLKTINNIFGPTEVLES